MKFIGLVLLTTSLNAFSQQKTILPYEVKEEGQAYEVKENAGMNKFQRIGRNERAIQELYQRIEALEKKIDSLQNAKNNGQSGSK